MKHNDRTDAAWTRMCQAAGLDPARRLAARQAILRGAGALDCSVYRPDEHDPEAEEEDLGDAKILFTGPFQAPEDWDELTRADYFDGSDPALFVTALVECAAEPGSRRFFAVEAGDYLAATLDSGAVTMFYVYECDEDEQGRRCVLIRDDEALL
ncbi:hypothetical protein GCM10017624_26500 [Azotobacter vinelandii]|nr:hypothetical protein GCM10017624_26500 [Azotobacter vinelandii]SFY21494.1 hypothetical protein SAMN04244547_04516 [Azotobacter vinelandii]